MQLSKNSWSLQLHKALLFLFILTISACGGCGKGKGNGKEKGASKQVFIMLIHGIGDEHDGVSNLTPVIGPLKKALERDQGNKKKVIEVFAPGRQNSVLAPIKTQAEEMFALIQKKGLTKDDKVILVAHSQGGAVAMALYAMFMRDWENLAIVSVQGALCGAPAVQPNQNEFNKLTQNIEDLIEKIKQLIQKDKLPKLKALLEQFEKAMAGGDQLKQQILSGFPEKGAIANQLKYFLGWQDGQGGRDLIPNSPFMQELKNQMPNPATVPMLVVAGEVKDFSRCISELIFSDTKKRIVEEIREQTNELIAGMMAPQLDSIIQEIVQNPQVKNTIENNVKKPWNALISSGKSNDLIIPVDSQLGKGLIQGDKVKEAIYKDYTHLDGLLSKPMFDDIVKFIEDFIAA